MHTLSALLSLVLIGAAFLCEGVRLLRSGSFRTALTARLHTEQPLFTQRFWQARQKWAEPLYFAAIFVLLFGRVFLHESQLYTVTPDWVYGSLYLLFPVSYLLLTVKIFFCTQYDLRQCVTSAAFFVIILLSCLHYFDSDYFALMGFILACKDLDWRRVIAWFAALYAAFAAILITLSFAGVLSVRISGFPQMFLGFENPNHLARVTFVVFVALLLLLPAQKRRLAAAVLALPLLLFNNFASQSRSVLVALGFLLLCTLLWPMLFRLFDLAPIRALIPALPLISAAVSFIPVIFYNPDNALWFKINYFSTDRMKYWNLVGKLYSPTLFAQEINYNRGEHPNGLVAVDNAYVHLGYNGGFLLLAVMLVLVCILLYRLVSERRYWLLVMVMAWMVNSMFESFLFCVYANFTIFLLAPVLFLQDFPPDGTPQKCK